MLKINDQMGFHPSLRGFVDLIEAGKLAVVQGVGYPDPNRSHFESMDISGLKTSVYYVRLGDFDTHSKQPDAHQGLLRQLGDCVKAFLDDTELLNLKLSDRVTVMAFSEFGRRVAENASEGTDHGTAGPMFLAGSLVNAGLIGTQPSLLNLQDGDLE